MRFSESEIVEDISERIKQAGGDFSESHALRPKAGFGRRGVGTTTDSRWQIQESREEQPPPDATLHIQSSAIAAGPCGRTLQSASALRTCRPPSKQKTQPTMAARWITIPHAGPKTVRPGRAERESSLSALRAHVEAASKRRTPMARAARGSPRR